MGDQVAVDRDALYYPYIRIKDANWLKATLLCFPRVRRILPADFEPFDSPEVEEFTNLRLAPGDLPLLYGEVPVYDEQVDSAYTRLFNRIADDRQLALDRFSWEHTAREFGQDGALAFRIHRGKMNRTIVDFLREHGLAWDATGRFARDADWYFVHPQLGEAIMSTAAVAIARRWDLDIVTDEFHLHRALSTLHEDDVYAQLAGTRGPGRPPDPQEVADELSMLVMTTAFDLSRLTPQQILELKKDGKDLRRFRDKVLAIAVHVPRIPDPEDRRERLKPYVDELVEEWSEYKNRNLPKFALDALYDVFKLDNKDLMAAAVDGAGSYLFLGGGFGLALGLLSFGAYKIWREFQEKVDQPIRYLSRIEQAGASLALPPRTAD